VVASPRIRTSSLAVIAAALAVGPIAACAAPQTASAGASQSAAPKSSTPFLSDPSALSTAGMGTFCPLVESGTSVQVTFAVSLAHVASECAAASQQLSTIIGGSWHEASQEDFSLPLACAVLHQGESVVIRDSEGSPRGAAVCKELIAAGWTEEPSTNPSSVVFSTAS